MNDIQQVEELIFLLSFRFHNIVGKNRQIFYLSKSSKKGSNSTSPALKILYAL
jgi:hypothetical protein